MALTGALCYGELSARFPEAGGAYVYLREAWGEPVAFLYGWKCLLVMDPGIVAALAAGLSDYVAYLVPLGPGGRKAVAVGTIVLLAAVTALGTRLAARTLVLITVLKLGLLAVIVGLGFASGQAEVGRLLPSFARYAGAPARCPPWPGGFVSAFFSFGGWWEAARMAGEVRDPERTLPRAFVLGIAIVTAVYVLTTAAFLGLVPLDEVGTADAFAARVGERLFGEAGGTVLALAVVVSVLGSLAALMLMTPRVYVALARDGLFPARLARLAPPPGHARHRHRPAGGLRHPARDPRHLLRHRGLLRVRDRGLHRRQRRRPLPARGAAGGAFRAPGRRFTAAIFVLLSGLLLALLVVGKPLQALLGVLVVALGVPVYGGLRRAGMLGKEER